MRREARRRWGLGIVVLALTLCALSLCGCAFSSTITQIIYEQNEAYEIDYDAPKIIKNTQDSDTEDDSPQSLAESDDTDNQDEPEEMADYGEGDEDEASDPVQMDTPQDNPNEGDGNATNGDSNGSGTNSGNASENGNGNGGESAPGNGEEADPEEGENPEEQGENQDDIGKGKNANNEIKIYEDYGDFPETPEDVTKVAAVGEAAVIVTMLGGSEDGNPLVAADADFVNDADAQKVLADKGISSVKAIWSNDGTSEGDLADVKKLIATDIDLCFVMEGDDTLTDDQKQALLAANVLVYTLPSMSSPTKITSAVRIVGDILEAGGNEQAGQLRDEYLQYHSDMVAKFTNNNNGITGGFDYGSGKDVSTNATPLYTLLVTDWDTTASYSDQNGYLSSDQGVAVSEIGYETDPYSYYMSVGGVINNAAAGGWKVLSGRTAAVWQFTTSKASIKFKQWTSIDRTKVSYAPDDQGFDSALMWSVTGECGLGSEDYPAIIVSSQAQKTLIDADAQRTNGLYHPYSRVTRSTQYATTTTVGFSNGNTLVDAVIGINGVSGNSCLNDGTTVNYYPVYVNPQGLFSNWLHGGVESILESSWVYAKFRDTGYDVESDVKDFYEKFYGYELSDSECDAILAGPEE